MSAEYSIERINQSDGLSLFLESKAEDLKNKFENYTFAGKVGKGDAGFDEYFSAGRLAYDLLVSAGMKKEELKPMTVEEMFRTAHEIYDRETKPAEEIAPETIESEETEPVPDVVEPVVPEAVSEKIESVNSQEIIENEKKGIWYEGIEKDLVRAVRPVHKFKDKEQTKKRPEEDVQADYREVDGARQRLGEVYRNIRKSAYDQIDEERLKKTREIRFKVEDACKLIFDNWKNVRSGMKKEDAVSLLTGLGIALPEKYLGFTVASPEVVNQANIAQSEASRPMTGETKEVITPYPGWQIDELLLGLPGAENYPWYQVRSNRRKNATRVV